MPWKLRQRKTLKRLRVIHYHRLFLLQRKMLMMNLRKCTLSDASDHDGQIVVCFSVFLHFNVCSVNITSLYSPEFILLEFWSCTSMLLITTSISNDRFYFYIFVNRSYFSYVLIIFYYSLAIAYYCIFCTFSYHYT